MLGEAPNSVCWLGWGKKEPSFHLHQKICLHEAEGQAENVQKVALWPRDAQSMLRRKGALLGSDRPWWDKAKGWGGSCALTSSRGSGFLPLRPSRGGAEELELRRLTALGGWNPRYVWAPEETFK